MTKPSPWEVSRSQPSPTLDPFRYNVHPGVRRVDANQDKLWTGIEPCWEFPVKWTFCRKRIPCRSLQAPRAPPVPWGPGETRGLRSRYPWRARGTGPRPGDRPAACGAPGTIGGPGPGRPPLGARRRPTGRLPSPACPAWVARSGLPRAPPPRSCSTAALPVVHPDKLIGTRNLRDSHKSALSCSIAAAPVFPRLLTRVPFPVSHTDNYAPNTTDSTLSLTKAIPAQV